MAAPYLDHVGTDKYANQCDKPTTIQDWEQRTIVSKMRHTTEALHKVAYNNKLYGNKDLSLSKYGQKLIDEAVSLCEHQAFYTNFIQGCKSSCETIQHDHPVVRNLTGHALLILRT